MSLSVNYTVILDTQIRGTETLKNPSCEFHINWDFEKNMGLAMLHSINGSPVNITLHPLGIAGQLDFMSDMEPTKFSVNASNDESIALVEVVIYRVILDTDAKGENPQAAIMFGVNGESIQASGGFQEGSAAKELPPVSF